MKRALSVALLFVATVLFAQNKRAFTIEDFYRVKSVSDLARRARLNRRDYPIRSPHACRFSTDRAYRASFQRPSALG